MAGMGTGTPNYFKCPVARRSYYRLSEAYGFGVADRMENQHRVRRTGKTKPNPSRRRTQRTLDTMHEFVCSCGHRGWSRISGILDYPIIGERKADA